MKTQKKRNRNDPRREATSIALIEKAEALIAEAGVDAVSTRHIGAAIGSSNNNVVAYHFGSKKALIEAIYRHRLPALEQRRTELLAIADEDGSGNDIHVLMHTLWLPLFEQTNSDGLHSYAGFLASLARSGMVWTRLTLNEDYPVTLEIVQRIESFMLAETRPLFMDVCWFIFSAFAMINQDKAPRKGRKARRLFADALRMASAAIIASAEQGDDEKILF